MGWWIQAQSWKVDSQVRGGRNGALSEERGNQGKEMNPTQLLGSELVSHWGAPDTNKEERRGRHTGRRVIKAKITSQ